MSKFDYNSFITETVDDVSRRLNYDATPMEVGTPMSTGWLILDLLYGGGIRAGWYTHFGKEQSSKTTGTIAIMAASLKSNVPIVAYSDFEGSSGNSLDYVQSILKTMGIKKTVKEIFGSKDEETGKWINTPLIRYRAESIGERFFDWLSALLRSLPDKRLINKQWWLVFEDTKQNRAKLAEDIDTSMSKKYGNGLWVKTDNGELQALIIIDSYPAMNPEANDEDDGNKSLASQARMFSANLPRVKGRLSSKMVAVVGTNQLRDVPMAMFGPKEQEPGGQALRYYSDCRCQFTPRVSGMPFSPGVIDKDTRYEVEDSVECEGGTDNYRYIHLKTVKNKLSLPNRTGWLRIWAKDGFGSARGYDPVFDTVYYLQLTNQIAIRASKYKLMLDGTDIEPVTSWKELKQWVLGNKKVQSEISKKLGYKKPFSLRAFCFHQMRTGKGEKLYIGDIEGKE